MSPNTAKPAADRWPTDMIVPKGYVLPGRRDGEVKVDVSDSKTTGKKKSSPARGVISFRRYQEPVFRDHKHKTVILHWSRQIGKSFTLAAWAIDRLLRQLKSYDQWLITVLSNSRDNGAEFVMKCTDVCSKMGAVIESEDLSEDLKPENMRFEVKIRMKVGGVERIGRIKVLAANPRTARGFSGDLILDEFAFHEDSRAIWEAAEPIISSNPEFQCRIASTGNGRQNMFYQLISEGRIPYYRVRRSDAHKMGEIKIYSAVDGREITPDEAKAESSDKRAYDQNYECTFEDEAMPLLTQELISKAERAPGTPDFQTWNVDTIQKMWRAEGTLEAGYDVARRRDLSVIVVYERIGQTRREIGELIMENMRLNEQIAQAEVLLSMPKFRRIEIDMTGIGLGVFETLEERHGSNRVGGVDFSTTEPVTDRIKRAGRKAPTARVTEIMATDLLGCFEDGTIEIFADKDLRDDLRKPEKVTTPGGRVSIAASRDGKGHADRFWARALGVRAGMIRYQTGKFSRFIRSQHQAGAKRSHRFARREDLKTRRRKGALAG